MVVKNQNWKKKVADKLRTQGYVVHEEFPIRSGKTINLVPKKAGNRIAKKIETGKSDTKSNIPKCRAIVFQIKDLLWRVHLSCHGIQVCGFPILDRVYAPPVNRLYHFPVVNKRDGIHIFSTVRDQKFNGL
jgi:hypothetical protein